MEPYLTQGDQLCVIMSRVRAVAEPIQRGDTPYSFSMEQMFGATTDAARVMTELLPTVIADPDPAILKIYTVFSSAQGYLKSLCLHLLTLPEVDQDTKQGLLFILKVHAAVMAPVMEKMQRNFNNLTV